MNASAFLQAFHFASVRYIQRNTSRCKGLSGHSGRRLAREAGRIMEGQQAAEGGRERARTRPTHPRCWNDVLLLPTLPLYLAAILVMYFVVILLAVCAPLLQVVGNLLDRHLKHSALLLIAGASVRVPLLLLVIWLLSAQ
jgi:hypothetical protein